MIKASIFAAIAIFGGMLLLAASGHAADVIFSRMVCGSRTNMIRAVENVYGEKEKFNGDFGSNAGMRIFLNPITKTFTIFMDGKERFCMVASGGNWKTAILGEDL